MKMKATILLAALMAAALSVVAEDVIVWTTIIEWVGPGGTPISAPAGKGDQALGGGIDGKVVEHDKNPAPAPIPTTSAIVPPAAAPVVNENVALHQGQGGQQGKQGNRQQQQQQQQQQQKQYQAPSIAPSRVPAPVALVSPSGGSTGGSGSSGGGGGFDQGNCDGEGMNIFWTGDEVDYNINWHGDKSNTTAGTTKGCTNLGVSSLNVDIGGVGGTLFEGDWNGGGKNQFFDVSFIYGFSVPVLCKAGSETDNTLKMSGCSIDLHEHNQQQGMPCPNPGDGKLCKNPTGPGGAHDNKEFPGIDLMSSYPWCYACSAPDPFFGPCAAAGYAFPYDDAASVSAAGTITCCVGTSCGATNDKREGSTAKTGNAQPHRDGQPCNICGTGRASKRGLEAVIVEPEPQSPALLPGKHKRHQRQHRHAAMHEANKH